MSKVYFGFSDYWELRRYFGSMPMFPTKEQDVYFAYRKHTDTYVDMCWVGKSSIVDQVVVVRVKSWGGEESFGDPEAESAFEALTWNGD